MVRLATEIWINAYLARLNQAAIAAYIAAKGDDKAGAVLVKLARLDGTACLFERVFDFEQERRHWQMIAEGPEHDIDAQWARARSRDRDLWVVEVEDRQGRHLLQEPGLDE